MAICKALLRFLRVRQQQVRVHSDIPISSIVLVSTTQEHTVATPVQALPLLPPEIWTMIIHHATEFSLAPPSTVSFLDTPSRHSAQRAILVRTKLALCLVSRPFHEIAKVCLWERVSIKSEQQAVNVLGAISGNEAFVRHLSISSRIPPSLEQSLLKAASKLFSYESLNAVRVPLSVLASYVPHIRHLSLVFSQSYTSHDGQETTFPQLTSLKLTLPHLPATAHATPFETLARFLLVPKLKHLSVLSSDAYYGMQGFEAFFDVHGRSIVQLELGGVEELQQEEEDTDDWEEYYDAIPSTPPPPTTQNHPRPRSIPLSRWCPSLTSFICSSDAEWNWEEPDWIAPHVLLPTHAGLEVVGIKSIHNRINTSLSHHHESPLSITPFFPLVTQFASLLNPDAFPRLRYIRDLSEASGEMRMGVGRTPLPRVPSRIRCNSAASSSSRWAALSIYKGKQRVEEEYDTDKAEEKEEWYVEEDNEEEVGTPMMTYAFDPCPDVAATTTTKGKGKQKENVKEKEQTWRGRWRREFPKSSPSAVYVDAESVGGSLVSLPLPSPPPYSSSSSSQAHSENFAPVPIPIPNLSDTDHRRVLQFWASVLRACQSRQVWLEDWQGVNLTMGGLRRVAVKTVTPVTRVC